MKDGVASCGSVIEQLELQARIHPDRLACCFLGAGGEELERHSYTGFLARVRSIAAALMAHTELAPGARVLLVFPQGLEMVAAYFACAHTALIAVPVAPLNGADRRAALERIVGVAHDCEAGAVLCGRSCLDQLDRIDEEAGGAALVPARSLRWIVAEDIPDSASVPDARAPNPLMMLQYTSGSTRRPRGVMVSGDNILANCAAFVDHPDPVAVSWLPQHHDMGLIGGYLYPLLSGGTAVGMSPATFIQRPATWLQAMSRYRATGSSAPNFAYDFCADPRRVSDRVIDGLDLSSLRFLAMAAEPVRPASYQRFLVRFGRTGLDPQRLVAAYGLAENTLAVTHYGRGAASFDKRAMAAGRARPVEHAHQISAATRLMRCGAPLAGNDVRIVDPETLAEMPGGLVGEIWVRGASVCAGYWNDPAATAATFEAQLADGEGGFLRTGDLGFLHDGELFVSGRVKDLIIVRGQNHFPQDIEAAAEEASAGLRSGGTAAVALAGEDGDASVVLVAEVRRRNLSVDPQKILGAVRDRLGLQLDRVVLVPPRAIPTTTSGKIRHFKVARILEAGTFPVIADHRARQQDTSATASLVDEIRARHDLRGDEDCTLFDAGVDSLDLVVLMHELRHRIGRRGPEHVADQIDVSVVQRATIRDLFRLLDIFETDPGAAALELPRLLTGIRTDRIPAETARMREDIELYRELPAVPHGVTDGDGAILLTGATGFLGPHLLEQALAQSDNRVVAMVRGADPKEATERLARDAEAHGLGALADAVRSGRRLTVVCGDLRQRQLGMAAGDWQALRERVGTVVHNGADVNYLRTYDRMRGANVIGTLEALRLSREGRPKRFVHISTLMIFGWQVLDALYEDDRNDDMRGVDFGYSQSKWVSEQIVHRACDEGQHVRVIRPAFLSPTVDGRGLGMDITLRLFAFILKHGIGIDAGNEISLVPVDVAARNICAVGLAASAPGHVFHVTRNEHVQMKDVMAEMTAQTGRKLRLFRPADFVPEVIRRCTREDPLYPLVDFFIHYIDRITAIEHKRYDNRAYRAAVKASGHGAAEPGLDETVAGVLRHLDRQGQI